jgi:predicted metal-dependent HD superfamily phosphohydrolase
MDLKRRWLAFLRRAGASRRRGEARAKEANAKGADAKEAFAELDRRYREPGRHYHTWAHVAACLRELRQARPPAADARALELAVWFHDAVYEPGRGDNEQASAGLALRWSEALGLAPELGRRAAALILTTRHLPPPGGGQAAAPPRADPAEALLRDIDLAVLGSSRSAYLRYERAIAREYAGMPPESFREGRARLLRELLARPVLYGTPAFRRRLEKRARRNLARALLELEGGRPTRRLPARRPAGPAGRPDPK